jgi:ABC-type spermidine/putrescine transport system permease subunit II
LPLAVVALSCGAAHAVPAALIFENGNRGAPAVGKEQIATPAVDGVISGIGLLRFAASVRMISRG